ncbi:MAG: iron-sulfur cluster assembly scaffold protein [Alphaproteobacteria bacterium]|nr:iron-sulfur cluster assembly scaffold protein [Alphaproteobacteria bacterium]
MKYSQKVEDINKNPKNVGSFQDSNDIGTGLVGAPACGDVMKLQIKVEKGVIVDACFKTFGCKAAIASSSLATEMLKGKSLDEALAVKNNDIAADLALPPIKKHCSTLAEEAIQAAVENLKEKQ